MKTYKAPIIVNIDEMSEGVYMAGSGASSNCFTCTGRIVQKPVLGSDRYVIQIDAQHLASDGHHGTKQTLSIIFNTPVTFLTCTGNGAQYVMGDGTSMITINYTYHTNASEKIGLGSLEVFPLDKSKELSIISCHLSCNKTCAEHNNLF